MRRAPPLTLAPGPPISPAMDRILIVDDDEALRDSLQLLLAAEGHEVAVAEDADAALRHLGMAPADVVLCDVRMPGTDGMDLLPQLVRQWPGLTVLMMSAFGAEDLASEAIRRGAYDYLQKPFQPGEVLLAIRKARERARLHRDNALLQREVERVTGERPIVAASEPMIELLEMLERAAEFKATVLLVGESGTGKEVLARAIHAQSPRREQAFVAVNAGAIPEALLESELFGHAKGAFTGADRARRGLFAEAHHGTLFLDEIGELPQSLQVKLLRVLQEEEVRPGRRVEAPNRRRPRARRDLPRPRSRSRRGPLPRGPLLPSRRGPHLAVPPLRERRQDIPLLVDHFIAKFRGHARQAHPRHRRRGARTAGRPRLAGQRPRARERHRARHHPQRRRPHRRRGATGRDRARTAARAGSSALAERFSDFNAQASARKRFERDWIEQGARRHADGNRTHAARLLQISHRSLLYKIKEFGLGTRGSS